VNNLNERQSKAAVLLSQGFSYKDVGCEIDVSVQTVCEWRKNTDFKALVNRIMEEYITDAVGQMNSLASEAVSVIEQLMESKSESIRLKAAFKLLDMLGAGKSERWGWSVGETSAKRLRFEEVYKDMSAF